jgi:sec-independent protein translocase protein TatC
MACALVMLVGSVVGFIFRGPVIAMLQRPLGQELFYTSPQGSFDFVVRVSMLIGLFVTLPVVVYNLLRFVEPALPRPLGRRTLFFVVGSSVGLTLCGAAFAYFVGLPAALHFFAAVGTQQLHALISADRYFSFVLAYLATFAVVFHLPLLLLLVNHITPLGPGSLGRWRKFVVAGAFAVALVIPSAPDPLSQVILALPLIALYEVSIWLVWLANRRRVTSPARLPAVPVPVAPPVTEPAPAHAVPAPRRVAASPVLDLSHIQPEEPAPPAPRRRNVLDLRSAVNDY